MFTRHPAATRREAHRPQPPRPVILHFAFCILHFALPAVWLAPAAPAQRDSAADLAPVGLAALARPDLLPRFRPSVKVAMVSSYDRTGVHDDGFSGRHSFVRKEGDTLVLADLKGPGVITRLWTPTPSDDPIEFFFDGEEKPRLSLPFRELFTGARPPFVAPLSGYGAGGFWTYLPLPYRVSCKVVLRAPRAQFYQLNYATYPDGFPITTFDPAASDLSASLEPARRLLGAAGTGLAPFLAAGGVKLRTTRVTRSLAPGKTVVLFEQRRGGRILGLRLGPARALAGKDRDLVLRLTWDGEKQPASAVPVGDFFGASWGEPAARSLLLGTADDTSYCYFPMPFDRAARLELVAERASGPSVEVRAEVLHADRPRRKDEGRFYALWRRESPTTEGQPFTFVDTPGRGHLVGVALQAQGSVPGETPFFEGDDQTTIDGELTHHGTGSEDFFNGGWYDVPGRWESRVSFPLAGCLDYKKPLARTGAYRLLLADACAFNQSLKLTIEHAPERNTGRHDYVGTTYLYAEAPPAGAGNLAPVAERRVRDPERIVFTPGWNLPVYSFSLRNMTLAKKSERIDNREARYLSVRAEGDDVFGPHHLSFLCEAPAAGKYRVAIEALAGPAEAKVQLFRDERAVGPEHDLYAPDRKRTALLPLGSLELKEGLNPVFLKLIGKHPLSTALGLDLLRIELQRE